MPINGGEGRREGGGGGGGRPHSALEVMSGGAALMWDPEFRKMDAGSFWNDEVHRSVSDAFVSGVYPARTQEEADESHSPSAGMLMRGGGARSADNGARSRRALALDLEHCDGDVPEQLRGLTFSVPEVLAKGRPRSAHPNKGLPLQTLQTKDARLLCNNLSLRPSGMLPNTSTPPSAAVKGPQTPREEGMRAFRVRPASKLRRLTLGEGFRGGEGGGRGADARGREQDEDGEERDGILGEVSGSSVGSPDSRADTLVKLFMTQRGTTVANAVPFSSRPVSALVRPETAAIKVGAGGGGGAAGKGGGGSSSFGGRANAGTSRRAVGCGSGGGARRDWDAGSEGRSEKSWDENVEWLLEGNTALKRKTEMRQKAMSEGTEARDHVPDHVRFETSSSNMSQAPAAGVDLLDNKDQKHTLAGAQETLLMTAKVEVKREEAKEDELEAATASAEEGEEEEEEEESREDVRSGAGVGGRRAEETRVHADDASGSEDDNCVTKTRSREMDVQICSPISGCTGETFTYTSGEESD
jgi:hypothetical protein